MKKVLFIVMSILIVLCAIGVVMIQKEADRMDQLKLQYTNEQISSVKRKLDFSPYDEALSKVTQEKAEKVRGLILGKEIEEVQLFIKKGKLSIEDVVLFYADRLKIYDDYYNSVIQLNPNALEQARALDERIERGEPVGSLAGIVMLIKDNVAAVDMNTSAGAYALKDLTTTRDAFVVEILKNEDAIILGKNNLSEWSNFMSMPSSNGFSTLGGQTKNAYGTFDVGGSSSGPAVASAMNFASITIGSETSGSLIYPAGQNSVVAIKPTLGVLSRDLVIPISEEQDTLGFMGRNVSDVYKVFMASVAVDPKDPKHEVAESFLLTNVEGKLSTDALIGKRVGIVKEGSKADDLLVKELEELGAEVVEVTLGDEAANINMMIVLNYGMVHDVEAFLQNEAVKSPFKTLEEIHLYNSEDPEVRMPFGDNLHKMALNQSVEKSEVEDVIVINRKLGRSAIDKALKENDVEVLVSFSNGLSGIYAPAGYPALTVPGGYRDSGEPYGVTFVGGYLEDSKLFQYAYAYETGTNHRKGTAAILK